MEIENERKSRLKLIVEQALKSPDVNQFEVDIFSENENSDGYLCDILFADVVAKYKGGQKKEFHLVLKVGKQNEHLRNILPVKEAYDTEIFMYNKVFPFCEQFQREKELGDLDFIAKCYKTYEECGMEMLVLENLKQSGYEVHNQRRPMNVQHICHVLEVYGKWHALSFAIKDQRKAEFEKIPSNMKNLLAQFMENKDATERYLSSIQKLKNLLQRYGENELMDIFNAALGICPKQTYKNLFLATDSQSVLTHGDCWNNNFMFKYNGKSRACPSKVAVIDWQLSYLRSPVFDLSYFIYLVTSKKELAHFDRMMDTYYSSFAEHLRNLGSDPKELFSFEDLMEHWRKYSLYGVLSAPMALEFALCEAEDAPNLGEISKDQKVFGQVNLKDEDQYYNRLRDILEHYASSKTYHL